jgi:branched-chain amino acid transport system substrate-binding protein
VFRWPSLVWFLIAVCCCTLVPAASRAQSPAPLEIYAVLSTTGKSAFFGSAEARALGVIEKDVNAHGGVNGHPLHFVVLDDQTTTQTAVQLVNDLIAKNVALFLGPEVPQTCLAAAPLIDKTGPVGFCLNPSARPEPGSYGLDTYADYLSNAIAMLKYFQSHGWSRIAFLNSSDASGREATTAFDAAMRMPQFASLTKVAEETYNPSDIAVSAQIVKIKAANAQAMVSFNTGLPFGTVLNSMFLAGLDIPVATTGGNMTYGQMKQYASFLPKTLLFDGMIGWVPGQAVGPGPIRDLQMHYLALLKQNGLKPEAGYATIWDPAMLAIDAYRHVGLNATKEQMRAYFSTLHGWTGIQGIYDFKSYPQRGLSTLALLVLTWDPKANEFVPASRRGGDSR